MTVWRFDGNMPSNDAVARGEHVRVPGGGGGGRLIEVPGGGGGGRSRALPGDDVVSMPGGGGGGRTAVEAPGL